MIFVKIYLFRRYGLLVGFVEFFDGFLVEMEIFFVINKDFGNIGIEMVYFGVLLLRELY